LNPSVDLAALVLASPKKTTMQVQKANSDKPVDMPVELAGEPIRVGVAWRLDECDPDVAVVLRVVPSSPAAKGGLQVNDRVYAVGGKRFSTNQEMLDMVAGATDELELLVERSGKLSTVKMRLAR
jgi:S1-C subfamily serine protease